MVREKLLAVGLQNLPRGIAHDRIEPGVGSCEHIRKLQFPVEEPIPFANVLHDLPRFGRQQKERLGRGQQVELVERPEPDRTPRIKGLADLFHGGVGVDALPPNPRPLVGPAGWHSTKLAVETADPLDGGFQFFIGCRGAVDPHLPREDVGLLADGVGPFRL